MAMNDSIPVRSAPRAATILSLLALTLSVGLACALWYLFSTLDRSEQERAAHARRVILVEEENAQLRRQMAELGQRIDDDDALNRSLREETLGIAERAALLEQAIKRVSENRMDSVSELRLNQAELLLSAGIERLTVFHDVQASLAALRLADAELARLGDARYAGVRQTLAQEIAALEALPVRAHADTLVMLADLRARVGQLPVRGSGPTAAVVSKKLGRFETLLRSLVQVRRINPREAGMLGPLGADTLRAVIVLDLLNAEEALRQRDLQRFRSLVQQARETLHSAFDLDAPGAQDVRLKLAQVSAYVPAELPQSGAALAQLVNLRHTQNVAHGVER
jgi:uroporphyrin-3 C-methyltransferase